MTHHTNKKAPGCYSAGLKNTLTNDRNCATPEICAQVIARQFALLAGALQQIHKPVDAVVTSEQAIAALREPLKDRPRQMHIFTDSILLLDDSGGECVTSFDDALAVHYFLKWLDEAREARNTRHRKVVAEAEHAKRRAGLGLVKAIKKP